MVRRRGRMVGMKRINRLVMLGARRKVETESGISALLAFALLWFFFPKAM